MIRVTASEKAFASVAALVSLIVGLLSLIAEKTSNPLISDALFFPLAPGCIVGLLITGGHGGTQTQEAIAPYVAAIVNIVCYLVALGVLAALWHYLAKQSSHRPPKNL
jgi:hypothetical protein